jgi:hypothetical protein
MKLIAIAIAIVGCIPFIGCYMTPLGTETEKEDEMRNWSASGTIDSVSTADGSRAANKPVRLQCNFLEAMIHTVQLETDMVDPLVAGGASTLIVLADITWKLGGNTAFRRVTLANGLQISGLAESVEVTVYANAVPQTPFHVSILAGIGVRPNSVRPPTLTGPVETTILAGNALNIPIPPGIGVISFQPLVYGVPVDKTNIIIQFNNGVNVMGGFNLVDADFVAIPGGATAVQISNQSANSVQASYNFGIDG